MNLEKIELNDLYDYGYMIYQNSCYFKFSVDSILLAEFIDLKNNQKNILDMCTGNAPIPMILNYRFGNRINIDAVEIQEDIYNLAKKSIIYNNINNINLINKNIKDYSCDIKYDIITCNPPYFKVDNINLTNNIEIKARARHEIDINLEEVIINARRLIKNGGYFYMVHRTERMIDVILLLNKYNFGIKKIVNVYNDKKSKSCIFLVETIFNGKNYLKVGQPIYIKDNLSYKNIFNNIKEGK